jgi:hypothetical protein
MSRSHASAGDRVLSQLTLVNEEAIIEALSSVHKEKNSWYGMAWMPLGAAVTIICADIAAQWLCDVGRPFRTFLTRRTRSSSRLLVRISSRFERI